LDDEPTKRLAELIIDFAQTLAVDVAAKVQDETIRGLQQGAPTIAPSSPTNPPTPEAAEHADLLARTSQLLERADDPAFRERLERLLREQEPRRDDSGQSQAGDA
jgi:hypothetical protein